jgi:hypothetical protein
MIVNDDQPVNMEAIVQSRMAIRQALCEIELPFDFILNTANAFNKRKVIKGSLQHEINQQGKIIYERH